VALVLFTIHGLSAWDEPLKRLRRMKCLRHVLGVSFFLAASLAHAADPVMRVHLEPQDIVNESSVLLVVEIDTMQPLSAAVLEVTPPVGFVVTPQNKLTLPAFDAHLRLTQFWLNRTNSFTPIGTPTVHVHLFQNAANAHALVDSSIQFKYYERISVCAYLGWGILGIVLGYLIRLIIKAQQSVPVPSPAPENPAVPAPPPPGPITRFITKYYYPVDGALTVLIGFLALLVLLKDHHAPDNVLYWYSALGSGVALGALTNSELITKVR
jgi:hypothetical protein